MVFLVNSWDSCLKIAQNTLLRFDLTTVKTFATVCGGKETIDDLFNSSRQKQGSTNNSINYNDGYGDTGMKVQIWKIHVCEGGLAAALITEYYVPKLGLTVNKEGFFLSDGSRYASDENTELSYPAPLLIETTELSDELSDALMAMYSGYRAFTSFKQVLQQNSEEQ